MAARNENGCLVEPPEPIEAARALPVYHEIVREIEAEFADRAVSVLQRSGLHAWRNPGGTHRRRRLTGVIVLDAFELPANIGFNRLSAGSPDFVPHGRKAIEG